MSWKCLLCAGGLLLAAVQAAPAAVIYLQDVDGNSGFTFEGTPVTHATFDDSVIATGTVALADDNTGTAGSMAIRTTDTGLVYRGILAVKDMFTLVPGSDNGTAITINSATLHLAGSNNSPSGYTVIVRQVTTDWMANVAGDNQTRVAGGQRNATVTGANVSGGQAWLTAGGNFGSGDYKAATALTGSFDSPTEVYGQYFQFNVTTMVRDIYTANQNYGFQISTAVVNNNFVNIR